MTHEAFDRLLGERLEKIRGTLGAKAREYASGGDRLHNFRHAAALVRGTPAQALWGMLAKHLVSVGDMVASGGQYTAEFVNEKVGDAINYLILLEAIMRDVE